MAIVTAGDVVKMEAKYLKAGMHIIRNDLELVLTMVDYNPGQDYPSVDYFFDYVDSSLEEDTLQAISHMQELFKRMTEKNRSDHIGEKI